MIFLFHSRSSVRIAQQQQSIIDAETPVTCFFGRSAAVLDEYISFNTSAFFIAQLIIFSPVPVSCDADVHSTDPQFEFSVSLKCLGLGSLRTLAGREPR